MTDRLRPFIDEAESLGLFPALAARIRCVAEDRRSSLADLERVVLMEPVLSAMLLRVANSAFYGLRRNVATVGHAILILGFRATRDMALGLALMSAGRSEHALVGEIWSSAVAGAAAARALSDLASGDRDQSGRAFVAALLRDFGRLVLLRTREGPYLEALARPGDPLEAERLTFGLDHPELGAACLRSWGLPEETCEAVGRHHTGPERPDLPGLVSSADRLVCACADGSVEPGSGDLAWITRALGLSGAWLDEVRSAVSEARSDPFLVGLPV